MELAGVTIEDPRDERSDDYETSLCNASDFDEDEQWDMAREIYTAAFARDMTDRVPRDEFAATDGKVKAVTGSEILGAKTLVKCCACMDVVATKNTLTFECKPDAHSYCRKCLVDLFKSAIDNPTLFPPRCCQLPVPLATCRTLLPKDLIKKFDLKIEELATPNPTYCSNAECSEFIRPQDIKAEIAICVFCKDRTCVRCKCANHKGLCPKDSHVQLLMDAARRSRWQQCTKCKNMVELSSGCFHMR
jgi:E3 ubiquitin-protein ligase RNF144